MKLISNPKQKEINKFQSVNIYMWSLYKVIRKKGGFAVAIGGIIIMYGNLNNDKN